MDKTYGWRESSFHSSKFTEQLPLTNKSFSVNVNRIYTFSRIGDAKFSNLTGG